MILDALVLGHVSGSPGQRDGGRSRSGQQRENVPFSRFPGDPMLQVWMKMGG